MTIKGVIVNTEGYLEIVEIPFIKLIFNNTAER